jgi:hypothetical protein
MQLRGTELNYPIHEKELLAIIRALKKWRADLLGGPIYVYTDHKTLENFETQKDLSRRQLRWQEYMSQYEILITYIKGENNTVADALSRIPPDAFPEEKAPGEGMISSVLSIALNNEFLGKIKGGYKSDPFCIKIASNVNSVPGIKRVNGLWYLGSRLLIPCCPDIRETLFRLAHDSMGHFGRDKSYELLRHDYYWPNTRRDLEESYIPGCDECQRNKSPTIKKRGPLHPLPVPDK